MYEKRKAHCIQLPRTNAEVRSVQESSQNVLPQLRAEGSGGGINILVNFEFFRTEAFDNGRGDRKSGAADWRQRRRDGGVVTSEDCGDETAAVNSKGSVSDRRG